MELKEIGIAEFNGKLWVRNADMIKYVYQNNTSQTTSRIFNKVQTIETIKFGRGIHYFEVRAAIVELKKAAKFTVYYPRKIELADYLQKKYDAFVLRNRKVEVPAKDIQKIIGACYDILLKLPDSSTEKKNTQQIIVYLENLIRGAQNGK